MLEPRETPLTTIITGIGYHWLPLDMLSTNRECLGITENARLGKRHRRATVYDVGPTFSQHGLIFLSFLANYKAAQSPVLCWFVTTMTNVHFFTFEVCIVLLHSLLQL